MGALSDNIRRMVELKDREIGLLRSAIDKSNIALQEAVKTKEERDRLLVENARYRKCLERMSRCTCLRGNDLVEDGHDYGCDKLFVMAALAPLQRRAGCDCGATVAFPSHQPGCTLHAEYRATWSRKGPSKEV